MPRSLFGRSLLMILFPVVVLQLVVGIVFIQRHFAQVTTQMARSVALELNYAADLVDEIDDLAQARALLFSLERPFDIHLELQADEIVSPNVRYYFYDVSGRVLITSLRKDIQRPISIDLTKARFTVEIQIQTVRGILNATVPRSRVNATNPHQLLVLMILTSILLTVISILFLRNQVRPIKLLADVSEAFGKGRVEEFRPRGATEVRSAGRSFLAMRARVERQIEARTQMLSSVSHDLRTPLTRLKLALAMMEESDETRHMQDDVEEMERMLEVFLAFARGDNLEETESVNVPDLLEKIVADCRRSGEEFGYKFKSETPKFLSVMLKAGAVSRAINNLLSNALRYGGRVEMQALLSPTQLTVEIEDDGPGIPESDWKNAMKPFVRLDEARSKNGAEGVGLGLAIAADVARSHGGSVELSRSETLGGLKASFTIPR